VSGETQSTAAGGPVAPAGWGTPAWLPPGVARRQAQEDAREALESKRAAAERELRAEQRHQRALGAYCEAAAARGEVVSVMDLAAGRVTGRTVQAVFAEALAASEVDDRRDALRLQREGAGAPVHIEVAEPVILQARSETGRRIFSRSRRFFDVLEARRQLAAAEAAARATRDHFPLAQTVTLRSREDADPVTDVTVPRRRRAARDDGLRFR
jgi:hypothetical protein